MTNPILETLERLIRTDPARRGLIATESKFGVLLPGRLALAAEELAAYAKSVAIVTGFYIPAASPPAAETDGPLGAALLASTLHCMGIDVRLVTDPLCENVLRTAVLQFDLPDDCVQVYHAPKNPHSTQARQFDGEVIDGLTHLISIERVGPSHSLESIEHQQPYDLLVRNKFQQAVRPEERNHCFNMRGICIDEWTAPLHHLFEAAQSSGRIKTIGIGDGGNEIGMGSVPWAELIRRLPEPHGAKIICRVPCDHTIIAGVSNWGAYALAAAVASLRNRVEILKPWTCAQQYECLERLVRDGPAVDGVTRLAEPTVDGLPFATYIQPWDAMRQLLELPRS